MKIILNKYFFNKQYINILFIFYLLYIITFNLLKNI